MPIARTTVAGAMALASQLKRILVLNYKSLLNEQKVSKQVMTCIKGPSDIMQIQLRLTPNSQQNCLCRALHATIV